MEDGGKSWLKEAKLCVRFKQGSGNIFVACERNTRLKDAAEILDQASRRMECPFIKMGESGRGESL